MSVGAARTYIACLTLFRICTSGSIHTRAVTRYICVCTKYFYKNQSVHFNNFRNYFSRKYCVGFFFYQTNNFEEKNLFSEISFLISNYLSINKYFDHKNKNCLSF